MTALDLLEQLLAVTEHLKPHMDKATLEVWQRTSAAAADIREMGLDAEHYSLPPPYPPGTVYSTGGITATIVEVVETDLHDDVCPYRYMMDDGGSLWIAVGSPHVTLPPENNDDG